MKNQETIDLKVRGKFVFNHIFKKPILCSYYFVDGTLDRYEKKIDAIENGSFPPTKEVADFEQAIELTGT